MVKTLDQRIMAMAPYVALLVRFTGRQEGVKREQVERERHSVFLDIKCVWKGAKLSCCNQRVHLIPLSDDVPYLVLTISQTTQDPSNITATSKSTHTHPSPPCSNRGTSSSRSCAMRASRFWIWHRAFGSRTHRAP